MSLYISKLIRAEVSPQNMQDLNLNSNPSDMSLVSHEFLRFKRGSVTIKPY
ncbi:hypothetical protein F383_27535 [Gossypium arboreum]|uniref:Uncharacterized protein n=1 Tax=Gossypium arboreum TaxID=29729 RepID=A0A0B0MSW9_GOSAR|nr:hypothetical protein F383_27535 [Gossypium arboreum]